MLEGLKNERSRRTIELAEAVVPVLRAHRLAQAQARLALPPAVCHGTRARQLAGV